MMSNLRTWEEVLEQDFPDTDLTREAIEKSRRLGIGRLPVGIRMGLYRTPGEFAQYIALGTQLTLPGSDNYDPKKNEQVLAEMRTL